VINSSLNITGKKNKKNFFGYQQILCQIINNNNHNKTVIAQKP
jgi:hypothetical protein